MRRLIKITAKWIWCQPVSLHISLIIIWAFVWFVFFFTTHSKNIIYTYRHMLAQSLHDDRKHRTNQKLSACIVFYSYDSYYIYYDDVSLSFSFYLTVCPTIYNVAHQFIMNNHTCNANISKTEYLNWGRVRECLRKETRQRVEKE